MQLRILAAGLGLAVLLVGGHDASGQVSQDVVEMRLFQVAYRAVEAKHRVPQGVRVIAINDPLLGTPKARVAEVSFANGRFASMTGLESAELKDVLACNSPDGCAFKGNIVATTSFRMESRWPDSAVVLVATRSFQSPRPSNGRWWQLMAMYEVRLVRRNGEWAVVSVSPRAES